MKYGVPEQSVDWVFIVAEPDSGIRTSAPGATPAGRPLELLTKVTAPRIEVDKPEPAGVVDVISIFAGKLAQRD